MASKMIVVALVVMAACVLSAQAAPGWVDAEAEAKECLKMAARLDGEVEDDGEVLIEHAKTITCPSGTELIECLKKDKKIKEGVASIIEKLSEIGEWRAKAEGQIKLRSDAIRAKKENLEESLGQVKGMLHEVSEPSTLQLFKFIVEEEEAEIKRLDKQVTDFLRQEKEGFFY